MLSENQVMEMMKSKYRNYMKSDNVRFLDQAMLLSEVLQLSRGEFDRICDDVEEENARRIDSMPPLTFM